MADVEFLDRANASYRAYIAISQAVACCHFESAFNCSLSGLRYPHDLAFNVI